MAFQPVLHEPFDSLRFGRVLLVELVPPSEGRPGRYADVLSPEARTASRTHFSVPEVAGRAILRQVERGASVEAVVFGGPGEPLRHKGLGSILRRLRATAHLETIVLTNGVMLASRDVRREAGEAGMVVAWLPALVDRAGDGDVHRRADAWERHVEGISLLGRETPVRIALEIPVWPGRTDGEESRAAWKRAVERIRPYRVFVIPDPRAPEEPADALERLRGEIDPRAGAYLPDGTAADDRG